MSSTEANETAVSFSNDVEDGTLEDGTPVARSARKLVSDKEHYALSQSAKAWDIDGDGHLDETEMALRNMDKSRKGTLSKDQMYDLMTDNLRTQRELFKVKKVVIGLVVFTCILALSNLGTSFAAAFLAKDTKTEAGNLVDTKTGKALGTDSMVTKYVVDGELTESLRHQRRLACTMDYKNDVDMCDIQNFMAFSKEMGLDIIQSCEAGKHVTIVAHFKYGRVPHDICPINKLMQGTYASKGDTPRLTINDGSGVSKPIVISESKDSKYYYMVEGLFSGFGSACNVDSDCAGDYKCGGKECEKKY